MVDITYYLVRYGDGEIKALDKAEIRKLHLKRTGREYNGDAKLIKGLKKLGFEVLKSIIHSISKM